MKALARYVDVSKEEAERVLNAWGAYMHPEQRAHFEFCAGASKRHVNTYFRTPAEHDRALADGAIRCMEQLITRASGREPREGFCHMLAALLGGMEQLRKEMDP